MWCCTILLNPLWDFDAYMHKWDWKNNFSYFYLIFLTFFNLEREQEMHISVPLNLKFLPSLVQSWRSICRGHFGSFFHFSKFPKLHKISESAFLYGLICGIGNFFPNRYDTWLSVWSIVTIIHYFEKSYIENA